MSTHPVAVCGVPIHPVTVESAAREVVGAAADRRQLQVHLCNAYTLSLVDQDARLRDSLLAANLNIPDGTPVAWLLRKRGVDGPVRGVDLLHAVIEQGIAEDVSHYFYGGWGGVAEAAVDSLGRRFPGMRVAGAETPPGTDLDQAELRLLAERVEQSKAGVMWVGLGTPRQDYLVHALAQFLDIAVVPIGAAFDYEAGTVPPPPARLQGSGLEWAYRLAREPRRLWRRYLIGNPRFVISAVRHRSDHAHPRRP